MFYKVQDVKFIHVITYIIDSSSTWYVHRKLNNLFCLTFGKNKKTKKQIEAIRFKSLGIDEIMLGYAAPQFGDRLICSVLRSQ